MSRSCAGLPGFHFRESDSGTTRGRRRIREERGLDFAGGKVARVAGIDGCPAGWLAVLLNTRSGYSWHRLIDRFQEVLELPAKPEVVGVDIPVGLLERAVKGGRRCDREARPILGQPRARSVFSPPVRDALRCTDYASANKSNRESSLDRVGISIQSLELRQKLLEMDGLVTPELQEIAKEVHPELKLLRTQRPSSHEAWYERPHR